MGTPEQPVPHGGSMARLWSGRPRYSGVSGLRRRPLQLVVLGFAAAVAVGTVLLSLPVASSGASADALVALFTATSAVCVTGLVVVDTATAWSPFGQVVILALIQVGGFGIMTLASLLALLVSRRLGCRPGSRPLPRRASSAWVTCARCSCGSRA